MLTPSAQPPEVQAAQMQLLLRGHALATAKHQFHGHLNYGVHRIVSEYEEA